MIVSQVLLVGFKSSRKFGKRLFLWDMVERACDYMLASEMPTPLVHTAPQPGSIDRQHFWNTVSRINSNYPQIGKNEKVSGGVKTKIYTHLSLSRTLSLQMALFLSVGLRDHHIATWLSLIAHCSPVLSLLYEQSAFLRDSDLLHFLIYTLSSLSPPSPSLSLPLSPPPSMVIRLEPLLTQGM